MGMYRIKFTSGGESIKTIWNGQEFEAKSPKAAWKKAMKEWGNVAEANKNSSVGSNMSFYGGKLEAELVEVHRREDVNI